MRIHILYELIDKPFGGVNQFLGALKNIFIKKNIYEEKIEKSDVILFNSHLLGAGKGEIFTTIAKLKNKYPKKIFIHRIDGPISAYRQEKPIIDQEIYYFNNLIADGTIFQSNWSKQKNRKLGIKKNNYEATIINAPNPKIFNNKNKSEFQKNKKIKLISTSWSKNINKGFNTYKYLDENLDFSKYEMTFIGNSPFEFKNIKKIDPLNSNEIATQIKNNDIYIIASKKDPCSNSLIEGLHCGLPAIALNDGGHPEIIKKSGEIFNKNEDIIKIIDKIVNNYQNYQKNINLPNINDVAKQYTEFAEKIYKDFKNKKYTPKKINTINLYKILFDYKIKNKIINKCKKIMK